MSPLSFPLIPGRSAADSLSLSTDGPIPHTQWCEAFAYDRANPLTCETVTIHKIAMKRAFGVRLLAFVIEKAISARGLLEERDLANLGLTAKQVADWKQEALALVLGANPALAEFAFQEAA